MFGNDKRIKELENRIAILEGLKSRVESLEYEIRRVGFFVTGQQGKTNITTPTPTPRDTPPWALRGK